MATWALGLGVQLTVPPASANAAQLSGTISLSDVGGALAGATFNGIVNYDYSGRSVSSAGDVNGDGLDDLLIGARYANAGGNNRGESYLVYGQSAGSPLTGSLNLSDMGGALAGATFNGIAASDYSGVSVSSAGDVNGDGFDDLLIGAYGANVGGLERGESYLVYGQSAGSPLTGSLNLSDVGGALAGATFNGIVNYDYSGRSVSSAGDVNGDGLDDLLIGAHGANAGGSDRGESYLVYGQSAGSLLTGSLNLADVGGAVAGATFNGIVNYDYSGFSVSSAGDVNGDGLDDLLIGAHGANADGSDSGESYLVYGQSAGSLLTGSLNLADVGGALAGATFNGIVNHDYSGYSVSSAGDANGDGLDDLLIGAYGANVGGDDRGESYLVYGQSAGSPLTGSLNLADVGGAVAGATFNGIADADYSGFSVSSAGDVNGDGLDDLLIGAFGVNADGSDHGESYLVYGQSAGSLLTGSLNLADVGGVVAGATFNGIVYHDSSGYSVSSAGDVNGDGLDDLLIGAYGANVGGDDRGESYLVYGQRYAAKWIDPSSDTWDDDLNWLAHQGPESTDDVVIQPDLGLTVQGPTAATTVKSLTIGAQTAGTATLDLNSGTLNVTGQTTIEQRGTLTGSGIINLLGPISNAGKIELGTDGLQIAGGTLTNTGLVRGGGTIDNFLENSAGGEVRVGPGQHLHLTGDGAPTNAGDIEVIGNATQTAEIEFNGALTNAVTTGNISARYATMRFNDGLTNQGEVGVSFGTSDIHGDIDNQAGATILIQGNSNVSFWDDLANNGTVQATSGSTVAHFGTLSGTGSFTGGGTNFVEGGLSPGSSPGTMSFDGDLVLGSASTTLMELAGVSVGAEHDQLVIAGVINLDGTLDLVHLAPYTDPAVRGTSDDFVLINAGARSGNFNTVQYDGSALTADFTTDGNGSFRNHAGGGLFRGVTYTATTVQLQNLLALKGDTDGDADVDLADYNRLATNFDPVGSLGPHGWSDGNTDGDSDIDLADYNALAGNFSPAGYGAAALPEPASVCLLLAGLLVRSWVRF